MKFIDAPVVKTVVKTVSTFVRGVQIQKRLDEALKRQAVRMNVSPSRSMLRNVVSIKLPSLSETSLDDFLAFLRENLASQTDANTFNGFSFSFKSFPDASISKVKLDQDLLASFVHGMIRILAQSFPVDGTKYKKQMNIGVYVSSETSGENGKANHPRLAIGVWFSHGHTMSEWHGDLDTLKILVENHGFVLRAFPEEIRSYEKSSLLLVVPLSPSESD